ncbi:MAG TPA: hypothetical protein VIS07_19075 [Candidatus Binatia bacterium]
MNRTTKGALIALGVAAMFTASTALADTPTEGEKKDAKVRCAGINECKGKGECAGAGHACGGMNECKGKGVVSTASEEECKTKGGQVVK